METCRKWQKILFSREDMYLSLQASTGDEEIPTNCVKAKALLPSNKY